jgi:hypothetical protein
MQNDIAIAANKNVWSAETFRLQKRLIRSEEGRILAFLSIIGGKGGKTPGPDGIVLAKSDLFECHRKMVHGNKTVRKESMSDNEDK